MHEQGRAGRRRRLVPVVRLAPALLVMSVLVPGCTDSSDTAEESPSPSATPVSEIDLTGVVASRAAFCEELDGEAVTEVLGGEPERVDSYESGQRVELAPGLRDVANEYSCFFERGSSTARAWLFARPATTADAGGWIRERRKDDRCRPAGDLTFGEPGLVQSCVQGSRRRVTAVGLFGDGWLTCQTTAPTAAPEDELLERTQRWCAEVALTTSAVG